MDHQLQELAGLGLELDGLGGHGGAVPLGGDGRDTNATSVGAGRGGTDPRTKEEAAVRLRVPSLWMSWPHDCLFPCGYLSGHSETGTLWGAGAFATNRTSCAPG